MTVVGSGDDLIGAGDLRNQPVLQEEQWRLQGGTSSNLQDVHDGGDAPGSFRATVVHVCITVLFVYSVDWFIRRRTWGHSE